MALIKILAYGIAAFIGTILGCAFGYAFFWFPVWLYGKPDILIIWGWFGLPIGFVGGVALFTNVTIHLGRRLAAQKGTIAASSTPPPLSEALSPNNSLERPR